MRSSPQITLHGQKLEEQLNESVKKNKAEIKKLVTEELAEIEKRNEKKIKNLYY